MADLLLKNNACPHKTNNGWYSPISLATVEENVEIVELLL